MTREHTPTAPGAHPAGRPRAALGEVVTFENGSSARLAGQLELVPVAGGVRPVRVPTAHWARFPPSSALVRGVAEQASGVRMMVSTAATRLGLTVRCTQIRIEDWTGPVNSFVVQVDGEPARVLATPVDAIARFALVGGGVEVTEVGDRSTVVIDGLPAGDKDVVIWFPQGVIVDVLGLEGDAPVLPGAPSQRPVWIHHGSSISHCADPAAPTSSWPVVAAHEAGLEVVNLGMSGQCMLDPFIADTIAATDADVISLKVGINIVGARAMDQRTFVPAAHGFIDRIRAGHPRTPIVVCSSILWPGNEDVAGPSDVELLGEGAVRCYAIGNRDDVARGALSMELSREHLRHVVDVRAAVGEPIQYLDGRELYGSQDAARAPLPDGLHPDAPIYEEMGRRFARLVFADGGLVPSAGLRRV